MSYIAINGLSKFYGEARAVDNFDLTIEQGEFIVFLGPSGCGKTTTLRMVAGFIEPSAGSIAVGGQDLTHIPAYRRNIGIVFQNYALFPHLTVLENVAFGLRRRKIAEDAIRKRVKEVLEMVQLEHLADQMPRQLSGGQQQRVAIARAIAISPDVLLLDEPLSNLDAKLRSSIRREIRALQQRLGITTILVTHDQDEAMSLADRIVTINKGAIQQIGTPDEIYTKPANRFVADFIGAANFINGRVSAPGRFETESGLMLQTEALPTDCKSVVIRPEALIVCAAQPAAENNVWPAQRTGITYLGPSLSLDLIVGSEQLTAFINAGRHPDEIVALREADRLYVHLPPHAIQPI